MLECCGSFPENTACRGSCFPFAANQIKRYPLAFTVYVVTTVCCLALLIAMDRGLQSDIFTGIFVGGHGLISALCWFKYKRTINPAPIFFQQPSYVQADLNSSLPPLAIPDKASFIPSASLSSSSSSSSSNSSLPPPAIPDKASCIPSASLSSSSSSSSSNSSLPPLAIPDKASCIPSASLSSSSSSSSSQFNASSILPLSSSSSDSSSSAEFVAFSFFSDEKCMSYLNWLIASYADMPSESFRPYFTDNQIQSFLKQELNEKKHLSYYGIHYYVKTLGLVGQDPMDITKFCPNLTSFDFLTLGPNRELPTDFSYSKLANNCSALNSIKFGHSVTDADLHTFALKCKIASAYFPGEDIVTDRGFQFLIETRCLTHVTPHSNISDGTLENLAQNSPHLTSLQIDRHRYLTQLGIMHVLLNVPMPSLTTLVIRTEQAITIDKLLIKSILKNCPNLKELWCWGRGGGLSIIREFGSAGSKTYFVQQVKGKEVLLFSYCEKSDCFRPFMTRE